MFVTFFGESSTTGTGRENCSTRTGGVYAFHPRILAVSCSVRDTRTSKKVRQRALARTLAARKPSTALLSCHTQY